MSIVDAIPYGYDNAMYISNSRSDIRAEIAEANNHGDCIVNIRGGYFRPQPGNEDDEAALNQYLNRELKRARAILLKRMKMKAAFIQKQYEDISK